MHFQWAAPRSRVRGGGEKVLHPCLSTPYMMFLYPKMVYFHISYVHYIIWYVATWREVGFFLIEWSIRKYYFANHLQPSLPLFHFSMVIRSYFFLPTPKCRLQDRNVISLWRALCLAESWNCNEKWRVVFCWYYFPPSTYSQPQTINEACTLLRVCLS